MVQKISYIILFLLSATLMLNAQTDSTATNVVIFVNGYWTKMPYFPARCSKYCYWLYNQIQDKNNKSQWNFNQQQANAVFENARQYFNTSTFVFVDGGNFPFFKRAKKRQKKGFQYIENQLNTILNNYKLNKNTTFHFVTHSMGAAYSEGMIQYLLTHQYRVGKVLHLSPLEAPDITTLKTNLGPELRIHIVSEKDKTIKLMNIFHRHRYNNLNCALPNTDYFACFKENDVSRKKYGRVGHALNIRNIGFDILADLEKINKEKLDVYNLKDTQFEYKKICIFDKCKCNR